MSPAVKDFVDLVASVGTVIGFLGVGAGWLYTRHESKQKGERAVKQIDIMATNCFPTMQRNLETQTGQMTEVLDRSDQQIQLLTNIDKGIGILVDRGRPS